MEAELEARKKQYEHYRTELLTFKDGTERERERESKMGRDLGDMHTDK